MGMATVFAGANPTHYCPFRGESEYAHCVPSCAWAMRPAGGNGGWLCAVAVIAEFAGHGAASACSPPTVRWEDDAEGR